tara:strand:- start:6843 stop:7313 length:471 start_codon:yes stop_codon:yes gene_type:complete
MKSKHQHVINTLLEIDKIRTVGKPKSIWYNKIYPKPRLWVSNKTLEKYNMTPRIKKDKKYSVIPIDMAWFVMRHKLPLNNRNFIATIKNKVDIYDARSIVSKKIASLIQTFMIRLLQSKTQQWLDYTLAREDCYAVEVNGNTEIIEIVLESEIINV